MKQTPMMAQYFTIKEKYKDELLFFRLGDFYELFYDDALTASRELNITLTGRSAGGEDKAPMCGVPFHASESYIEKLIKKGYKVAICEQVEDPKTTKGLVKRDVIRVVTPGTVMSENGTEAKENNFLGLFYQKEFDTIIAFADVTTGEVIWERLPKDKWSSLFDALSMYRPSELILAGMESLPDSVQQFIDSQLSTMALSPYEAEASEEELQQLANDQFAGLLEADVSEALGVLLWYLKDMIKADISHISYVHQLNVGDRMILDTASLRHLEISRNLRDGSVKGTLLDVLDRTVTPMGGRLLKQWIENPLMEVNHIVRRQQSIEEIIKQPIEKDKLSHLLKSIFDFERILGRIETGSVTPKDFVSLRESLRVLPMIQEALAPFVSTGMVSIREGIKSHDEVYDLLVKAIADQPALTLKEGNVFRDGYHSELDELRSLATNSQEWLQKLEQEVRDATGIRLKTGYNKVFGYYFEVSHLHSGNVPDYFIRKQTLANAERYITPELKEFEIKILSAKDKMIALEHQLYSELRSSLQEVVKDIQSTARYIAQLDVLVSLAIVAYEGKYIRPTMVTSGDIVIRDGRHPVIEKMLRRELFVPNDVNLNHRQEEFMLITGPNMAGKSTYMRQVAILMVMAQMGSFIPAREATISPVDRVFTRVGASDDISTGQSTFMVEMKEVAYILENATSRSLVILDEIGRGTSTFDGLSIAQAVVEYICETIHCKTLFATHYHELVDMASTYPKLKNYTVAVKEKGKDVVFLRRIVSGGADKSYGIHVARLAGLPKKVLNRADTILTSLESKDAFHQGVNAEGARVADQTAASQHPKGGQATLQDAPLMGDLFGTSVIDELTSLDIMSMTPIEALNELYRLQEEAKRGGGNR